MWNTNNQIPETVINNTTSEIANLFI